MRRPDKKDMKFEVCKMVKLLFFDPNLFAFTLSKHINSTAKF